MKDWFRHLFKSADLVGEERARLAHLLRLIALSLSVTTVLITLILPLTGRLTAHGLFFTFFLLGLYALVFAIVRRGHVRSAGVLLVSFLWLLLSGIVLGSGGLTSPVLQAYAVVLLIAGLVLGTGAVVPLGILTLVFVTALHLAEVRYGYEASTVLAPGPATIWHIVFSIVTMATVVIYLISRSIEDALAQVRGNEHKLSESYRALQETAAELRQREQALEESQAELAELVNSRTAALVQARAQLLRQEKLAILGQMAGGVGHELRNPLGVINNAIYFLNMTLTDVDATTQEYLDIIAARVREAEKIVTDLLGLSRTSPGEPAYVSVEDLLETLRSRLLSPSHITLIIDIAPNLPSIYVDSLQILQALHNIATNAIQAMPGGGNLYIHAHSVSTNDVQISIRDNGTGMTADIIAQIFEPLFTTKSRGIGLGLVVAKSLISINRGEIQVESEPEVGSTFFIRLPTAPAEVTE